MSKKEEFKLFIQDHPILIDYVKNKKMSFQEFYEIYDIYGSDDKIWQKYFDEQNRDSKISELTSIFKGFNIDNLEHHINNAQKAISIIQELTKKEEVPINIVENINDNFFGD